jgi:hypothetical protein
VGAFSLAQVRRQKLRSGSGIKRSDCPSRRRPPGGHSAQNQRGEHLGVRLGSDILDISRE